MGALEVYDIISSNIQDLSKWTGEVGYVQDILNKIRPQPENSVVFLAGSEKMVMEIIQLLKDLQFSDDQIQY